MSKHTPGRWQFGINPKGGYSNSMVVRPEGEFPHGRWIADCGNEVNPEQVANARLISAAPDLLEALKEMVALWIELADSGDAGFFDGNETKQVIVARAAIAKAEGRS